MKNASEVFTSDAIQIDMKESIYNNFLQINDRISVVYNSLIDKAVFVDSNTLSSIDETTEMYTDKDLFSTIFVEDDVDEYQIYLKEMLDVENQQSTYHLIINPTLECIFNCWYCYENHVKGHIQKDVLTKIYKFIDNLSVTYQALTISFFGGEPLMCYQSSLMPIVKYAYNAFHVRGKAFSFNMTTNGFLLSEKMIQEMIKYGFSGAQITIDGNREIHNKTRFLKGGFPSYDKILENIKALANNGCYVTMRLNCTNANIDTFYSLVNDFEDLNEKSQNNITIDCHVVWQEKNKEGIQSKLGQIISHFNKHKLNAKRMAFRQFCYADKRAQCVVNFNGDVYKCTAIDFTNTQRDGVLTDEGCIVWENDSLEKRMLAKQRNKRCRMCRVLPLCHGGCSSRALESSDYCLYPSEDQKNQLVVSRLEQMVVMKKRT